MPAHILANAKAYAALVGSVCTALLGVYGPDTQVGHVLTIALAVATALTTWAVPNQAGTRWPPKSEAGLTDVGLVIAVVALVAAVLALFGVRA